MPKYNVTVCLFGHNFNINNIDAPNQEEAEAKAIQACKKKIYVVSSTVAPCKEEGNVVDYLRSVLGY